MSRLYLVFFLSLSGLVAQSQSSYDELFQLSYDYLSPAKLNNSDALLTQKQLNVFGGYGFELNESGDLLSLGLSYNWLGMATDQSGEPSLSIHNTFGSLDWLKNWKNPYWASTVSASIGVVSDYKTDMPSAYQTLVTGMLHYGRSNKLVYTFGLLQSFQPFGSWVFPVLGVDWRASDRFYFSTIVLSHAYLEYAVSPYKWYIGLDIRDQGLSFALSDFNGQQNSYVTSFSSTFPYFPYSISFFSDYYLQDYISVFVKAGTVVSRENHHFNANHEIMGNSVYSDVANSSLYFSMGASIRYRNF